MKILQALSAPLFLSISLLLPTALQAETKAKKKGPSKPLFKSGLVRKGIIKNIDVDVSGAKRLYLVLTDGGNGYGCDWADWAEPHLVGPKGEKKLTEIKWKSAAAGWGRVNINKNAGGGPLRINGVDVPYGIGTHANSLIVYDIKGQGYTRFKARVGADNGGTDQAGGNATSVEFYVYIQKPPKSVVSPGQRASARGGRGPLKPEDSLAALITPDGLEATLFAAEPMVQNPTNIDIDSRGRVWVCEGVNYRRWANNVPEGDKIKILEDTDDDGKADKVTIFYQGRDVNAALGICVLGNKVLVSSAPNMFVFTDEDGDDKADKKEILFTGVSGKQHDHALHAVVFGPDGKLYFNFGNSGRQIKDAKGNQIVDMAGNPVTAQGRPYRQGMVFRCNLDGSEFETLGHNFRNNYEVCVDSFGTLWQSDNDDDGNRGVRINYVMEFGNFGYTDEFTGAGWRTPRTNMHPDRSTQHWRQNDPGVVPNFVQTGAGSPTGITVYEGKLLPEAYQGQVIHCDAGPRITRAYPATKSGAGYEGEMLDLLTSSENWYRPADVCTADDGSVFVADWYDAGVGGHNMADRDPGTIRGRIYRVAPNGHKRVKPNYDFATIAGAAKALRSPNFAVRYLAWTKLNEAQSEAEAELLKLWQEGDPRIRARAINLLARIKGKEQQYVEAALADKDEDIRIVGVRMTRMLKMDVIPVVKKLVNDSSAQVRRELAIALRHHKSPEAPGLWAELAAKHEAGDRWSLEALGIGADKQHDAYFGAWVKKVGDNWNTPSGQDIVWRSRAANSPDYLAKTALASKTAGESLRYFRALDFQANSESKQKAIEEIFVAATGNLNRGQTVDAKTLALESLNRMRSGDPTKNPKLKSAVRKIIDSLKGSAQFVTLVDRFRLQEHYADLLAMATTHKDSNLRVSAIRVLLAHKQAALLNGTLRGKDEAAGSKLAETLGNSGRGEAIKLLLGIVKDDKAPVALRKAATAGAARQHQGAKALVVMAKKKELPEALKFTAALALSNIRWRDVRAGVKQYLSLPPSKDRKLPPMHQLISLRGNLGNGRKVFERDCAKCHQVNGRGTEVGPDLSEIGAKLGKDGIFESVLFPDAGISHNYETWTVATEDDIQSGILINKTDQEVAIRNAEGIVLKFRTADVTAIKKEATSLMPKDLQKTMSTQDLVDAVHYTSMLRVIRVKKKPGDKRKIVFIAGTRSHGYGAHEFNAGSLLMKKLFKEAMPELVESDVHLNGFPRDWNAFNGADAIVVFCNGGGGHLLNRHLDEFDMLMKQGVSLACMHYGVEVPKGKSGNYFLEWIGGYFEANWSVNPHWEAEFKSFPDHPITRGVKPFKANDEWYFHMRFQPEMKGVTPILSAHPPKSTMSRGNGAHSGNPHVRKAMAEGKIQHVAWAYERPDGGRGFGFTGLHYHWNFKNDNFRKVVLNAVAWIAGLEVPENGIETKTPTQEELEQNQDYPKRR